MNYKSQGVYRKTYENPKPSPRPDSKPNFPSHAIAIDKNPAIVKPTGISKPGVSPGKEDRQKPTVKPAPPAKGTVKPSTPSKVQPGVKPATPSKVQPDNKSKTPVKVQPKVVPVKPSKKPSGTGTVAPPKSTTPPNEREKK